MFLLIEAGSVSVIAVMHVDDIFAVGVKRDVTGFARTWASLSPSIILASYDGTLVVTIPETRSRVC